MLNKEKILPFVRISCSNFDPYCPNQERIKHYPTIRIYHNNEFIQLKNNYDNNSIRNWLEERLLYSY